MEGSIDMERKGCESIGCYTHFVTFNVFLTHDLDLGFSRKSHISGMGWPIDMELKGCESIECWTHAVTFNVHPRVSTSTMTFTLDFQGQILKKSYLRNGMADWHGTKGMWVHRMLHPLCDFQCPPHPWPWPWIFKVKFWKCYTHFVTFNIPLTHDLDLGFSRSNFEKVISQEWDGRLTWNERDVSQ